MNQLTITALVGIIVVMVLCHLAKAATIDDLFRDPVELTCVEAKTFNGSRTTCSLGKKSDASCPEGEDRVCVRRYGHRTCGCYPSGE